VSAPTTTSDKVINSSAGSKVRSAVRWLVILAAATGIITLLYFWHTNPRRRVRVSERKAQVSAALTEEAREIDAAAAAAAAGSSSVFADESDQSGELVPANAGVGETPSRDDQPLASLLPRAMSGSITQSPVDTIPTDSNAVAPTREADGGRARPNPRPRPRRSRSSGARGAVPGDSIVENSE